MDILERLKERATHEGTGNTLTRICWDAVIEIERLRALLAEQDNVEPVEYAINTQSKHIHTAVDAFWQYWREYGETHKHGYYESTWGAINQAIRYAGVVAHKYTKEKIEVKGTTYLSDIHPPKDSTE